METGTVSAVTSAAVFRASGMAVRRNGIYRRYSVVFTSGALAGERRQVSTYQTSTMPAGEGEFTVSPAFDASPAIGDEFDLMMLDLTRPVPDTQGGWIEVLAHDPGPPVRIYSCPHHFNRCGKFKRCNATLRCEEVIEDFNRADGPPGNGWSPVSGFSIVSNKLQTASTTAPSASISRAATYERRYSCQARVGYDGSPSAAPLPNGQNPGFGFEGRFANGNAAMFATFTFGPTTAGANLPAPHYHTFEPDGLGGVTSTIISTAPAVGDLMEIETELLLEPVSRRSSSRYIFRVNGSEIRNVEVDVGPLLVNNPPTLGFTTTVGSAVTAFRAWFDDFKLNCLL